MVKNPPTRQEMKETLTGSTPGRGNGNTLQYSCLGNPMDREARWATVHGVSESNMTEYVHTHILRSTTLTREPKDFFVEPSLL